MKRWAFFLMMVFMAGPAVGQKGRMHVLTYKYDTGDRQRVSTGSYRTFTTTSPVYQNSVYGETAFDAYEEILDDREDLYTLRCTFELTRLTHNGENLTYKLARLFRDDVVTFTFDRYGVIDTTSVRHENVGGQSALSAQTSVVRNFLIPLPDHPVKVGDKWNVTEYYSFDYLGGLLRDVKLSGPVVKGAYTLESVDRNMATITLTMEVSGKGQVAEAETSFDVEFFVLVKGTFVMSLTEGKLMSGSLNADVAGLGEMNKAEVEFKGSQTTSFNVEILD